MILLYICSFSFGGMRTREKIDGRSETKKLGKRKISIIFVTKKYLLKENQELNSGPLAPEARMLPLHHSPKIKIYFFIFLFIHLFFIALHDSFIRIIKNFSTKRIFFFDDEHK